MNPDKPELAWTLQDYLDRKQEPPLRLESSPESCEGLLMSDDEVLEYVSDGIRTLSILKDQGSQRFEPVRAAFFADLEFLVLIDRLDVDDYNDIIKPENYSF